VEFLRVFPATELRAEERDAARRIVGYAAVFDAETLIGGWYREIIRPGAFRKTLTEHDAVALWNHDTGQPLGRKSMRTLELEEDGHGLRFDVILPDTSWGRDAWVSVERGDVKGASFAFDVIKQKWTQEKDALDLRELQELRLWEISPVTFPAYEVTEAEARAVIQAHEALALETRSLDATEEPTGDSHSSAGASRGADGVNMALAMDSEPGLSTHSAGLLALLRRRQTLAELALRVATRSARR